METRPAESGSFAVAVGPPGSSPQRAMYPATGRGAVATREETIEDGGRLKAPGSTPGQGEDIAAAS